ncbi:MAG TPA: zinc ribbon domain-containing protein [Vicinamibacterales bacterium]|nr:zinc ribbon domain-containing protein [Vicinamibacterales bacterium]
MPLYEYKCDACGARFEMIRKFSDPPLEQCSVCGKGPVEKLVSSPAFHLKGSGWYATDYAKKTDSASNASSSSSEKGDKTATAEKADSGSGEAAKAADTKPADKPAPAPAPAAKDK